MKITVKSFSDLPLISEPAKILVNSGRWRLFRVSIPQNGDIKYLLFTESEQYLLKNDGEAECVMTSQQKISIELESVISFSK